MIKEHKDWIDKVVDFAFDHPVAVPVACVIVILIVLSIAL